MSISIKKFQCPTCGKNMAFDVKEQLLVCEYCGHRSIIGANISIDAEIQDIADAECPNCGGALSYDPATQNVKCPYCGSLYVAIDSAKLKNLPIVPDYIKPFSNSKEEAQKSFVYWLASGEYTPEDIFESKVKKFSGVFLPIWRFDVSYTASYTASIGYDHEEQYTDYESYWEEEPYKVIEDQWLNGKKCKVEVTKYRHVEKKRPVTKTRTVTEWFPHSGTVSDDVVIKAKAVSNFVYLTNEYPDLLREEETKILGTRDNNDISFSRLPKFCTSAADVDGIRFQEKFTAGYRIIQADIDHDKALAQRREEGALQQEALSKIKRTAPGDHIKDIAYDWTRLEVEHSLMARPFWEMVYEYDHKTYVAFCSGADRMTTNGMKPYDRFLAKLKLKYRIFLTGGLPFLGIGVILLLLGYFQALDTVFSLAAYIILGIITVLGIFGTCAGLDSYFKIRKGRQKEADFEKIRNNPKIFFKEW